MTSSVILCGKVLLLKRTKAVAFSIVLDSREKLNSRRFFQSFLKVFTLSSEITEKAPH